MKLLTDGYHEYHVGIDVASGKDVCVEERWYGPSAEYPHGSYELIVDGKPVERQPNFYWHASPPFVEVNWERGV